MRCGAELDQSLTASDLVHGGKLVGFHSSADWLATRGGVNVKSMVKKVDALEIETLRLRLTEAEEALQAISKGTIDALVVRGPTGPQISTLAGAHEPYRLVVERMHEGALTVGEDRQILYSNRHLADLLGYPLGQLVGKPVANFLAPGEAASLAVLLDDGAKRPSSRELKFRRRDGSAMPALVAVGSLALDENPALLLIITDLTA